MRTRDEQIEDLANEVAAVVCTDDEGIALAQKHILEAERRAEQRVRAEIGRDIERLDWLCRNIKGDDARRIVGVIADTGSVDLWRNAIDAAREAHG